MVVETLEGHQDEMTEVIKDLESDMASTAEVLKAQTAEVVATMTAGATSKDRCAREGGGQ